MCYFMHYFTWFIENFWDTLIEVSNLIIGEFQRMAGSEKVYQYLP